MTRVQNPEVGSVLSFKRGPVSEIMTGYRLKPKRILEKTVTHFGDFSKKTVEKPIFIRFWKGFNNMTLHDIT